MAVPELACCVDTKEEYGTGFDVISTFVGVTQHESVTARNLEILYHQRRLIPNQHWCSGGIAFHFT
jgi:hypothetical protein